jgi:hypothetical protein
VIGEQEERRPSAILFSDLKGFSSLNNDTWIKRVLEILESIVAKILTPDNQVVTLDSVGT